MNHVLRLSSGALRCEIVPAMGGAIAGLWMHDIPVLRSTPGATLARVRDAGSYPLVPFSNRVGHAHLEWNGTATRWSAISCRSRTPSMASDGSGAGVCSRHRRILRCCLSSIRRTCRGRLRSIAPRPSGSPVTRWRLRSASPTSPRWWRLSV